MDETMKRADQAERNRQRFPRFAAWLAPILKFDAEAKVLWCREGDESAGRVPPEEQGQ